MTDAGWVLVGVFLLAVAAVVGWAMAIAEELGRRHR